MQQFKLTIQTPGRGYYLITDKISDAIKDDIKNMNTGLLHVFLQHTSASLTINENADPTVREDLKSFEEKLVPRNFPYQHDYEGDDDISSNSIYQLIKNKKSLFLSFVSQYIFLYIYQ